MDSRHPYSLSLQTRLDSTSSSRHDGVRTNLQPNTVRGPMASREPPHSLRPALMAHSVARTPLEPKRTHGGRNAAGMDLHDANRNSQHALNVGEAHTRTGLTSVGHNSGPDLSILGGRALGQSQGGRHFNDPSGGRRSPSANNAQTDTHASRKLATSPAKRTQTLPTWMPPLSGPMDGRKSLGRARIYELDTKTERLMYLIDERSRITSTIRFLRNNKPRSARDREGVSSLRKWMKSTEERSTRNSIPAPATEELGKLRYIHYTLSEDRSGDHDSVMAQRLAALATRCQAPMLGEHRDTFSNTEDGHAIGDLENSTPLLPGATGISLPGEERAVQRLCRLGVPRDQAIQAFFALDKNEGLAAEFLLEQPNDDDDQETTSYPIQRPRRSSGAGHVSDLQWKLQRTRCKTCGA